MKMRYTDLISALGATCLLASSLIGCSDEKEPMKWVDLRYRVEDSYLLEAKNPETVSFLVKSTDPWEVFGKESWHTISPASGAAGEIFTVTITCDENTGLDDRIDTISIKSDYWTGKRFTITQKGIAYLETSGPEAIIQEGGNTSFDISSNQKWTAEVTEGSNWLSIASGGSGELDGTVTVSAGANKGERRIGIVTVFDRHGVVAKEVTVEQNGVRLDAPVAENGSWFRLYEEAQTLSLPISSNTRWSVAKGNPEDDDWYDFEQTEFDGDGIINVLVSEHKGSSVRTAEIILSTVAEGDVAPVVKTIRFKQANPPVVTTFDGRTLTGGTWYGPGELMPARYNFYLDSFTGNVRFFWIWGSATPYTELRYHINNNETALSATPWCSNVYAEAASCKHKVDNTVRNVLSFNIDKYTDEATGNEWLYAEWYLNDVLIAKAIADGKNDTTGTDDTFKVPFGELSAGANFQMSGNLTVSKWERVDHLVWGD